MKTCRKPIAMVLLLLIHLLTLQIGDAGHNHTNVSDAQNDPKIILEEVIITENGNNTRILANAVAEDTSKLNDDILSLLSKREIRKSDSTLTNSDLIDQDAAQSRTAIVNANEEDQLEDLEIMSRVIEKYEPQRLKSKKFKRKIVDGSNGTHDVHGKAAGSIKDLERAYAEVLRNISRKATELSLNNDDVTRNPYLSQAVKLKQVYIPEVTIRSVTNDGEKKSHSDIDPSFTLPALKNKKSRKLLKKYHQLNRTTTPRFSSAQESSTDEETAGNNESSTPAGHYFKVSSGKTKPRNGSLSTPTSISVPAERPKSRKWNTQYLPIQSVPPFTLRLNDSNTNNIIDANNLKNLNVSSDANAVRLPPRYNIVPRPFSILPSPTNSPIIANIDASYRKPSVSPIGFGQQQQQQIARSSANVLPLVLPTELFNPPPARHYVPIKRAKHLNLEGNSATVVSTEASPSTSPVRERTTLDYNALYATLIDTTRSPLVTVNSQRSPSDYYAITESPAETTVTKTNFATYIPSQTSASYAVRQQDDSQAIRKENFLPRAATYNSPDDEKSSLNENPGIPLYNKFTSLYSADVPNIFSAPKVIAQDFKQPVQPTQQQVSTLPYATLKSLTSTKVRPIAFSKPAPYYDSGLLVSQDVDRKLSENSDHNVKVNERSLNKDEDEIEEENNDDNDDAENYKTRVNQETYKVHKTPNKQREKEDRKEEEEDRYPQQSRNYGYQNKHYKYDENDNNNKNDDGRKKYENVRYKNADDDEEEVDETEEEEHVSIGKGKDKENENHQYNKYKFDTDHSDVKPHYDRKKYNKPKDRHDKQDYGSDDERRFEGSNKYFEFLYNDDEIRGRNEYREHSDKKKKLAADQYKKDRRDYKYRESDDESVTEDKPLAQRASRQDERYEEEQNNDDKRNYRISPRRDSLREDHEHEEYGESNPTHAREEYHQRVNDDRVINDSGDQDDGKEKARDHVHGETQEHAHKHEDHHEKKKHGGNHKFKEGGGAEHEERHHGHKGEKGEKGYKVWHEHEKADKGHHDKEHASKHYDEKGGEEKKHEEEGGYHKEHHHGEGGKKTAEFGEKGEHKKGHSTHGEHSVHKKDEFEKKTEFFDEFHEDGDIEKHGGHHHDHELKKGGHKKKGHHDSADHEEKYGKEEKHEKGGHHHEHKGHKDEEGHDHHYDHDHKYGKKEGHEHGKKWSFKNGDGGGGGDAGDGHKHNR